jgi:dihydroxyacetone kinase-like predicted kinase
MNDHPQASVAGTDAIANALDRASRETKRPVVTHIPGTVPAIIRGIAKNSHAGQNHRSETEIPVAEKRANQQSYDSGGGMHSHE